jgi:hypothetical protein
VERFVDQDFSAAEFRECVLNGARLVGVVMQDAEIDGLVTNLVVNDVEVTAYVEAELDRRYPVRVLIRSDAAADLRDGWRQLQDDWTATIDRLRETPGMEHRTVNGEWSALETLRHLVFVYDSWFRRCALGSTALFTPFGLAPDFVPDREKQGLNLTAEPSLDEVVAVRAEQAAELDEWLKSVTPEHLDAAAPIPEGEGWPPYARGRSTRQCLGTVLNEEWAHHGFCVRDLNLVEASAH